jgi:hypothetical protein
MPDPRAVFDDMRFITEFTVTDQHLKLLNRAYVGWDDCEFGAPEIDCKRPYGNSDVIGDIIEILGVPEDQWSDGDEGILPDAELDLTRLHAETATVLQIALNTGEFRTGRYIREKYGDWHRDGE